VKDDKVVPEKPVRKFSTNPKVDKLVKRVIKARTDQNRIAAAKFSSFI